MYLLTLLVVASVLGFLWMRRKQALSPSYVFVTLLTYDFYADYLVHGDNYSVIASVSDNRKTIYELSLMLVYLCCVLAALLVARNDKQSNLRRPRADTSRASVPIAWLLVGSDILKKLYMSDWHLSIMLNNMLAGRGKNPWSSGSSIGLGNETFIFTVIGIFLPIAAMLFGRSAVRSSTDKPVWRRTSQIGLLISLSLLFFDGSRTMFAAPVIYVVTELILKHKNATRRVFSVVVAGVLVIVCFSAMYLFRSDGFASLLQGDNSREFTMVYHQDDSYYWAIYAADIAESTPYRMQPALFAQAIVINPIPRYFWPGKPALLQEYYGPYKPYYVTTTFMGELIGMFGWVGGCALGVPIALCFLWLLKRGARRLRSDYGLILYFSVALYSYMCLRSLLNISIFLYFVLASYIVNYVIQKLVERRPARYGRYAICGNESNCRTLVHGKLR